MMKTNPMHFFSLLRFGCLLSSVCLAQVQQPLRQEFMSSMSLHSLAQMKDNSTAAASSSVPPYQRIRVLDSKDFDRLYPLINAYVQQPSLAETVTEMVVGTEGWKRGCYFNCELDKPVEETEPSLPVRDEAHIAIEKHVLGLGLDAKTAETMVESLEWEKRQRMGAWTGPEDKRNEKQIAFGAAAITILLSLCRNIETLYISQLWLAATVEEYLLKTNYGLLPDAGLQRLRTVEVVTGSHYRYDDERSYGIVDPLEYMQYFHRLPSIEAVAMEGIEDYQVDRSFFVARTGNMRSISVGHSDVSSGTVVELLAIPKALEEFRFTAGGLQSVDGGYPLIQPAAIGMALRKSRATLKVLDLDIDYALQGHGDHYRWQDDDDDDDDEDADEDMKYQIERYGEEYMHMDKAISSEAPSDDDTGPHDKSIVGSLRAFKAMTRLSISIRALTGPVKYRSDASPPLALVRQPPFRLVDALPPNLEYLCLYGYARGQNLAVDHHIDELMAQKTEKLPKLETILGVEEMVAGLGQLYDPDMGEEGLWMRPERDFDWVETEQSAI